MSKVKHTPGPWVWQSDEECLVGPEQIVMKQDDEGRKSFANYPDGTHFANARLIAAAPELLEALKDARYALYGNGPGNPKIDAAIAKAEVRE